VDNILDLRSSEYAGSESGAGLFSSSIAEYREKSGRRPQPSEKQVAKFRMLRNIVDNSKVMF
jgi:hypothetical protein